MIFRILILILCWSTYTYSQNQTPDVSTIYLQGSNLPFEIEITQAGFSLPVGIQSFARGVYKGKWIFLGGRTNGLHGFDPTGDFPPSEQNTSIYVVDPDTQTVYSKSFTDPTSGLTSEQIVLLSVTASEFHQSGNVLYFIGGYGVDTVITDFSTKPSLIAIDLPGIMHWVINPSPGETAAEHIRQTTHPLLQVTGGLLYQASPHDPLLLVFGQNFNGNYSPGSSGEYTQQVRCFQVLDNGRKLYILPMKSETPNANYRRRDFTIAPIIQKKGTTYAQSYVEFSGTFTLGNGIWTVPVIINPDGSTFMANPDAPDTFKQGMNNYVTASFGLFSKATNDMYILSLGGLSYTTYNGSTFTTDSEIPFDNGISTIKIDSRGNFTQYLMNSTYPVILSTFSNPGNVLLFGTGANFIPVPNVPTFPNGVFQLDALGQDPILVGYIVGGIQSTLPNTSSISNSASSLYIFTVRLIPL